MDKYDEAVEYLQNNPDESFEQAIVVAWNDPYGKPGGELFKYTGTPQSMTGCLTQVKGAGWDAPTSELTMAIRADSRVPNDILRITKENLAVFAEWQRTLDAVLGELRNGKEIS